MLTKVEIENYQSHKNTTVEFVPGTNVIIGESDTGKSAILNAINWVCFNRPLGDPFRSEWGGDTRVILHTSEGDIVERVRTASKNEYVINGRILKAFGTEPPEEVNSLLRIDIANIHAQMDRHFLLSSTPGEAAQMLNKAASIDDIDHVISELKKSQNRINSDIKYDQAWLKKSTEQIKQYENIPILESKIEKAEKLEKAYNEKIRNLKNLKQITERMQEKESQLKATDYTPELVKKHRTAEELYIKYQEKADRYEKFRITIDKIAGIEDSLNSTKYVEKAIEITKNVEAEILAYGEKREKTNKEKAVISRIKDIALREGGIRRNIDILQKEFDLLFPDVCPLCGK